MIKLLLQFGHCHVNREIVMKKWVSGIRGTVLMIVLWVIGWGLGFGGIMEAFIDPDGKIGDIWPTMMAVPGLVGGIVFSVLLLIAKRRTGFNEVPFFHFALWGVVTGIFLGLLTIPAEVGDVSPGAAGMIGIASVLGLVAGIGSGAFFRLIGRY
jgi:hypothetical protein